MSYQEKYLKYKIKYINFKNKLLVMNIFIINNNYINNYHQEIIKRYYIKNQHHVILDTVIK